MERLREFLKGGAGKVLAAVVVAVGLVAIVMQVRRLTTSEGERLSANRMFVDAETGEAFEYNLSGNAEIPAPAPSGKKTGYPAEACYWTKDGQAKPEPTWVLINMWKGSNEPTFCRDCGRLVVGHNPAPGPGVSPPPTKDEYAKGNRGSGGRR